MSLTISCFLTVRVSPPAVCVSRTNHRPLFQKSLSVTRPRAASSSDDDHPTRPDEDSFLVSGDNSPTEQNSSDSDVNVNSHDSARDLTSSKSQPVNNVAALHFENERQVQQLQETLATVSQSLAVLAAALNEVSSTIRVLSASLNSQSQSSFSHSEAYLSPSELRDIREKAARESTLDPPEPWDASVIEKIADPVKGEVLDEEDIVPAYLVEQNRRAHKLAYKLKQSFIQARIEGLGKPFQVAVEDFTDACIDAHALGIGLKELQLQLVLQDGSLTGAFAIRNQRWSSDPILNDESRIRALWVRLVYSTLAQLEPGNNEMEEETDPTDAFVKQVLELAVSQGYDLERLKLEQTFAGPEVSSGAVKAMRENQYLILLTLEKARPKSQ